MTPRVQYVTTADGLSIAFSVTGEGTALVHMLPMPFRHVQAVWDLPEERHWMERVGRTRSLVQYDPRGMGLSERGVVGFSLDALVLDIEAVVEHVGAETVALLGAVTSGPVAVAYAARHPERVSHLMLWCTSARIADLPPQIVTLLELAEKDWELFTEAAAHALWGWSSGETAHRYAAFLRESVTPEVMRTLIRALPELDVTALLPRLRSPTLVLHRRQLAWPTVDRARELASRIPGARLTLLEGATISGPSGDQEPALRAIDEFLGDAKEPLAMPGASSREPIGPVAILFTDIEDSTSLTQRLGDARARELLRAHERIVREALRAHGGAEVKTMGDAFMAAFGSATRAVECAIAVQAALSRHNEQNPQTPIRVRIGINVGEPVVDENDYFGAAVNLAARIAARAEPGGILVSDVVRQLTAGKGFRFAERGEAVLRGFDEPVRLYEVQWQDAS
jgi:class 3 adenylate cyclase